MKISTHSIRSLATVAMPAGGSPQGSTGGALAPSLRSHLIAAWKGPQPGLTREDSQARSVNVRARTPRLSPSWSPTPRRMRGSADPCPAACRQVSTLSASMALGRALSSGGKDRRSRSAAADRPDPVRRAPKSAIVTSLAVAVGHPQQGLRYGSHFDFRSDLFAFVAFDFFIENRRNGLQFPHSARGIVGTDETASGGAAKPGC